MPGVWGQPPCQAGSRSSTTSARRSWSAGSCPTATFAEPEAALLGGRWTRPGPGDPAPVFVRPEVAVEVSLLGWEAGRLRHPAYAGLTRVL